MLNAQFSTLKEGRRPSPLTRPFPRQNGGEEFEALLPFAREQIRRGGGPAHATRFDVWRPRLVTRDPRLATFLRKARPTPARSCGGRPGHVGRFSEEETGRVLTNSNHALRRRRSIIIPPITISPSVAGSGVTVNVLEMPSP